jgi:hypothetical protein
MHLVVGGIVRLDRQEGAGADMQGKGLAGDPRRLDLRDQSRREVERGGRSRHCALLSREHGLVVLGIGRIDRPLGRDVGRERHGAGAVEQQLDRLVAVEAEQQRSVLALCLANRLDPAAEGQLVVDPHASGVANEGPPGAEIVSLVQRGADPRLTHPALELGWDDLGIVEDQDVARIQKRWKVADAAIFQMVAVD